MSAAVSATGGRSASASPAEPAGAGATPTQSAPFSVLVVDDQPQLRSAIVVRLGAMGAGRVHEAASVAEARQAAHASGPCDVAILGLSLAGGGSVLELLGELRSNGWPRIAVLAAADDRSTLQRAIQAGAHAYLLKPGAHSPAADGVLAAAAGLASGLATPNATNNGVGELSQREIEVLQLVAGGRSNKEIGEALTLSALTVKSHLSRLARKLNTGDRAQMVALAMRAGVIR